MTELKHLAEKLWQSRQRGTLCPFPEQPMSVDQAYALQTACTVASGDTISGYKIGATSDETLGVLGLTEPFYGPIYTKYTSYTQPDKPLDLPLIAAHNSRVEAEFVACLKNPIQRKEKDIVLEELLEHIEWVASGFEFVGSRYTPPTGSRGTSVIADFGAHQHSVIGAPYREWRSLDLRSHEVSLTINGDNIASGHSGLSIYGHPLSLVCWLLNQPAMSQGLGAGQIISCGTCTGAVAVKPGDVVVANYGELGTLAVSIL